MVYCLQVELCFGLESEFTTSKGLAVIFAGQENPLNICRSKEISEMPLFLLKKEFLFFLTKSENFLFFFFFVEIFDIF